MTYILIVEDNFDNAEILSIYLESQELPTQHISGGYDILSLVIQQPPALIFMDVNLPDSDGRVLCHQIKNRLKDQAPPIIIMTAGDGYSYKKTALLLGADDFLQKPLDQARVLEKLKAYLPIQYQ